jgi:hypothetical protein
MASQAPMGGLRRGRKSKATATCPRPGHAGSRVKFDRTYGAPGHRRSATAACQPTATVRMSSRARCRARRAGTQPARSCERPVQGHDGPEAARQYQFVARGIAGALTSVGAGSSYMRASRVPDSRLSRIASWVWCAKSMRSSSATAGSVRANAYTSAGGCRWAPPLATRPPASSEIVETSSARSTACTRSRSVATSSLGRTGTGRSAITGPLSYSSSTR